MKITKSNLRKLIKEEIMNLKKELTNEVWDPGKAQSQRGARSELDRRAGAEQHQSGLSRLQKKDQRAAAAILQGLAKKAEEAGKLTPEWKQKLEAAMEKGIDKRSAEKLYKELLGQDLPRSRSVGLD
tara:strand:- start:366 stop:746 length:381 start_codon:yes stop_codon:yes gene_type:complete